LEKKIFDKQKSTKSTAKGGRRLRGGEMGEKSSGASSLKMPKSGKKKKRKEKE